MQKLIDRPASVEPAVPVPVVPDPHGGGGLFQKLWQHSDFVYKSKIATFERRNIRIRTRRV